MGEKYEGKIDLLVGGSPCQSFSIIGKRGGFKDTRGTLFYEYARIIKEVQPKAFIFENNSLKTEAKVYKFTIDQLNYYNDSIIKKMNEVRKELNIKNNNVKQMQYLLSSISKKDTIIFKDTLFKDAVLKVDTIVSNKWYTLKLGLCYPSNVSVNPTFISEKYIVISKKKETINPPKKFFLFRWFQKKHWIMEVNIKEKNPYINELDNKFIEIIE